MSTQNTDYSWYWYVRKKGRKYYLGLINNDGDDASGAYDIDIYYDEIPDEYTSDDETFNIPVQYEKGVIKSVAAEIMVGDENPNWNKIARFNQEYEEAIYRAIHMQIEESAQPNVLKPFDLRDDEVYGSTSD